MSDADKSSKTEQPTGKRLQELFNKGSFPRAAEISVVFVLSASFALVAFYGRKIGEQIATFSRWIWGHLGEVDVNMTSMAYYLPEICKSAMTMVMPIIIVCVVAAIMAGGLQTGFKITNETLKFDMGRLNPMSGLQRLFSPQKLVAFGVELSKFIVIAWVISGVIIDIQKDPIFYTTVPVSHIADFIFETFLAILSKLILALGIIAALHFIYQKWKFIEDNKMTKQEVEDEMKNSEGNPQIKGARRKFGMRYIYRQIFQKVPLADVVVTNPTHFAVALKYERGKDAAPVVLAKGKDLVAQKIKQLKADRMTM